MEVKKQKMREKNKIIKFIGKIWWKLFIKIKILKIQTKINVLKHFEKDKDFKMVLKKLTFLKFNFLII